MKLKPRGGEIGLTVFDVAARRAEHRPFYGSQEHLRGFHRSSSIDPPTGDHVDGGESARDQCMLIVVIFH